MDRDRLRESVDLIREVFYYINRFKGQTFVFQIENSIIESDFLSGLIKDLAMLKEAGINIVIVPGANRHIDRILSKYGIETRIVDNIRISQGESIPFIKMAAFDVANKIMTSLSQSKINAVIGNWVVARGRGVINGVDFQETGIIDKISLEPLMQAISNDLVPIFPCIGWNAIGKPYNISSRELALTISKSLKSSKLFFVGEDGRIRDHSQFNLTQAREYKGEQEALVKLGLDACENGVRRVHLVDGKIEGVILKEIFSNNGVGTMIHANSYEKIRPMTQDDIADVLKIMKPFVNQGILIERSQEKLLQEMPDFVVYEIDKKILACGALHIKGENSGEIAGIATDFDSKTSGSGKAVVDFLLEKGISMGVKMFFALTTHTSDWFETQGFSKGSVTDLPKWKQDVYNHSRNSRIYIKRI